MNKINISQKVQVEIYPLSIMFVCFFLINRELVFVKLLTDQFQGENAVITTERLLSWTE